jgi:hypothetical protein
VIRNQVVPLARALKTGENVRVIVDVLVVLIVTSKPRSQVMVQQRDVLAEVPQKVTPSVAKMACANRNVLV